MGLVGKACHFRRLKDWPVAFGEQQLGFVDAQIYQIHVRRKSCEFLKFDFVLFPF